MSHPGFFLSNHQDSLILPYVFLHFALPLYYHHLSSNPLYGKSTLIGLPASDMAPLKSIFHNGTSDLSKPIADHSAFLQWLSIHQIMLFDMI